MRKLPGGDGQMGQMGQIAKRGQIRQKFLRWRHCPALLPLAKVRPWMQPINCLVENLNTKPRFTRYVIFSGFFIPDMYPKLNKL